jgi:nucleotide-binding universal stress UspA family protein
MKIMVAYDGSDTAQRALTVAQKRTKLLNAKLHIFSACGNGNSETSKESRLESFLKDAEMMCKACGISCCIEASRGKQSAAQSILDYARTNDIDEIVIGLRKRSQLGKMLFGSTARQVILDAQCPVLTVK